MTLVMFTQNDDLMVMKLYNGPKMYHSPAPKTWTINVPLDYSESEVDGTF